MSNIIFRLHCPNCDGTIEETDIFCPHCGINLDAPLGKTELDTLAQENLENARHLLESGRHLKKALAHCDQAITYTPESAEAHNLRGLILDGLGRTAEAISAYKEALRLNPDDADAKANLTDAAAENQRIPNKSSWKPIAIVAGIIILVVCLFAGAGGVYYVARPYLTPKTTVIFEPDLSRISSVTQADLELTAQILKQRWDAAGYPGASFTVSNQGQIIGQIPVNADPALITSTKAIGVVEFVDFGATYHQAGKVVNTDFGSITYPQVDGPKWHTIMTNAELKTVSVSRDQNGNYQIDFTLTDKGKKILSDYTTQNIGSYLGITLDKGVISCPTVNGAITGGSGQIAGGEFTYETANQLAIYMRYTPLPIPLK